MRAIDADALIKVLVRKEPFSDCSRVVIAECMEEVRHAPTIEPERKTGEWIDIDCPNCGCSIHIESESTIVQLPAGRI